MRMWCGIVGVVLSAMVFATDPASAAADGVDEATRNALLGSVAQFVAGTGNGEEYSYFDTQRRRLIRLKPAGDAPDVSRRDGDIYVVHHSYTTGSGKKVDVGFVLRKEGSGYGVLMAVHDQAALIDQMFGAR